MDSRILEDRRIMDSDAVLAAGEDRPGKRSRTFPRSLSNWVMIDCFLSDSCGADSSSFIFAYEYTSTGDRIGVGFRPVRPPSTSCLMLDWVPHPERAPTSSKDASRRLNSDAMAVAAHRNSILLRFLIPTGKGISRDVHEEFFVYQVCPGSSSPPSLRRLPACCHDLINRNGENKVGILCLGDNAFTVAHLIVTPKEAGSIRRNSCPVTASLCYIRSDGSFDSSWRIIKGLRIRGAEDRGDDLFWWETDVVVPCGDYICWVDYLRGILFCDVLSAKPELHYVALPVDPYQGREDPEVYGRGGLTACRTVCVTNEEDGYVIRYVDVADISCWFYGRPPRGSTSSRYSTISSWRLNSDMRTWKLDSMIENGEFLTLTKLYNLPPTELVFPLVDLNDPQTIYCPVTHEECKSLMTVNMSKRTLVKTPYTFGSIEQTSKGGSYKSKHPCNLYYSMPFLPCELICNEASDGGDSYNNSNLGHQPAFEIRTSSCMSHLL